MSKAKGGELVYNEQAENLIEIAWTFKACASKYPQLKDIDSTTWKEQFVEWANEFEHLYPDSDYELDGWDYSEKVEVYATEKILDFGGIHAERSEIW